MGGRVSGVSYRGTTGFVPFLRATIWLSHVGRSGENGGVKTAMTHSIASPEILQ